MIETSTDVRRRGPAFTFGLAAALAAFAGCGLDSRLGGLRLPDGGPPGSGSGGAAVPGSGGVAGIGSGGVAGIGSGGVAGSGAGGGPMLPPTTPDKLDLIFMMDNSAGMAPVQQLFADVSHELFDTLAMRPGGLPDLHVGVVSSSMGAGRWADVPGCEPQPLKNDDGGFHYVGVNPPGCAGPSSGGFLVTGPEGSNFPGSIADAFRCIALLGDTGCGFEHQLRSVQTALERAADPSDPVNGGFLRPEARLAVVLVTNEDDCSVPPDSDLFDPRQSHVSDPLGGLQTGYRCVEFGLRCGGQPPPHTVAADTPLSMCTSAEDGVLVKVADVVSFLRGLKPGANDVFVAAVAPPPTPVVIELRPNIQTADGSRESQPAVKHACTSASVSGDPAVRINELVRSFGANGVVESTCDGSFTGVAQRIGDGLVRMLSR